MFGHAKSSTKIAAVLGTAAVFGGAAAVPLAQRAVAAGPTPITSCSAATVAADLAAGGSYVFQCNGTISLTSGVTVTGTLSLDATGHTVTLSYQNPNPGSLIEQRFADVEGGSLTLTDLTISGWGFSSAFRTPGLDGANGFAGTEGTGNSDTGPGGPGSVGADGIPGTNGADATTTKQGGAIKITSGTAVVTDDTFKNDSVIGDAGGAGGEGGNGGEGGEGGTGAAGLSESNGGAGAAGGEGSPGGNGGTGGAAQGGAIWNGGTLSVTDSVFQSDDALGGTGGAGGEGGTGGVGGAGGPGGHNMVHIVTTGGAGGAGGAGGDAGLGGHGGDGQGGAIYNVGTLSIATTTFASDLAEGGLGGVGGAAQLGPGGGGAGGAGGEGGAGGNGFGGYSSVTGSGGAGGDGGQGAAGGSGGGGLGGGVDDMGRTTFGGDTFTGGQGVGGAGGPGGFAGAGGAAGVATPVNTAVGAGGNGGNGGMGGAGQGGGVVSTDQVDDATSCTANLATGGPGGKGGPVATINGAGGTPGLDGPPGAATDPNCPPAGPPPTVTSVAPPTGPLTGQAVQVFGTNLLGATSVTWTATLASGTVIHGTDPNPVTVSGGEVDAQLPDLSATFSSDGLHSALGDVQVTVGTTKPVTSAITVGDHYVYGGPIVTAVGATVGGATSGPIAGGTAVTLTGAGFLVAGESDTVSFAPVGGGPRVTATHVSVLNDTTITAVTGNAAASVPPGASNVVTDTEVTVGTDTSPANPPGDRFTFGPPSVTAVVATGTLATAGPLKGGTAITISGSGFGPSGAADAVNLVPAGGGTPIPAASVSVINDSTITATTTDATAELPPGAKKLVTDVEVTVPAGQTSVANPPHDDWTYATIAVTDVEPRAGRIAGGTKVVLTGYGFGQPGSADAVDFVPSVAGPGVSAASAVVISDTEIDVVTPNVTSAMAAGSVNPLGDGAVLYTNVQVTNADNLVSDTDDANKFTFPLAILQLGDSIASGEGTLYAYQYNPKTMTWGGGFQDPAWLPPYDDCHDSPYAYGNVVATALKANFYGFGCTGATYLNGITAPEIDHPFAINHPIAGVPVEYRPAEYGSLGNLNPDYDTAAPDVVLATFGADDIKFVDIVKHCLASALVDKGSALLTCTPDNPGATTLADFNAELPLLQTYYGALVASIKARGTAASPHKIPKIVFTDYMDPFPPAGTTCPDTLNLTDTQVQFINGLLVQLNSLIRSTVTALAASDPNVGFADISHALDGHTWCTSDPWDYGLSVIYPGGGVTSEAPFHPTPAGQNSIAQLVLPVVQQLLGMTGTTASITSATSSGSGSANQVTAAAGGTVSGTASGFGADETVDTTLHSTPVDLGTFTADSTGTVSFSVTLPPDTPSGIHQLILTGDTSGQTAILPVLVPTPPTAPTFNQDTPATTATQGSTYVYDFATLSDPTPTFSLSGDAPDWLTIDPVLGILTGTPPAGTASFTYSVIADNGIGTPATAGPFTVSVSATGGGGGGGGGIAPPPASSPSPVTAPSAIGAVPTRLAGAGRVGTAVAISQATFPGVGSAGAVVLARDDMFPDALAGGPLAAARHAPVLLTGPTTLDPATRSEIERVLPADGTVYLLGGSEALDPAVADAITGLGLHVVRYAGADRYATAVAVASALGDPATILLADGTTYADAIGAGSAAATAGGAVLLTDGPTIPSATAAYLATHPPATTFAIGGPAVAADPSAVALAGANRYATAVAVARQFFPSPTTVGLVSGLNYPDALTGGAAAALTGSPILLTDPATLSPETLAYLQSITATLTHIDVYGGTRALSPEVVIAAQQSG